MTLLNYKYQTLKVGRPAAQKKDTHKKVILHAKEPKKFKLNSGIQWHEVKFWLMEIRL